jgi:hypothetical protein
LAIVLILELLGGIHPNASLGSIHPNASLGSIHPNAPLGGIHPNASLGGIHPNAFLGGIEAGLSFDSCRERTRSNAGSDDGLLGCRDITDQGFLLDRHCDSPVF